MFEITISPRLCLLRDQSVFPTASKYSLWQWKWGQFWSQEWSLEYGKTIEMVSKKTQIKILTGVNHDNENFSRLLGQTLYISWSWYIGIFLFLLCLFFPAHSFYSHVVMTSALMENCIMMLFDCHLHSSKFMCVLSAYRTAWKVFCLTLLHITSDTLMR